MSKDNVIDLSDVFAESKLDRTLRHYKLTPCVILAQDEYGNFELIHDPEVETAYITYALDRMKLMYLTLEDEE